MHATPGFHSDLLAAALPLLRAHALSLTRNRADAEDLVQDAAMNAFAAADSFAPGTHFGAWMHRILRNRFISASRRRRPAGDIEDAPQSALAVPGAQEDTLVLGELARALGRLPRDQREALVLVVLHGTSYDEVSEITGCAVGTAKSRVFRARRQLEAWLAGGPGLGGGAAEDVGGDVGPDDRARRRDRDGRFATPAGGSRVPRAMGARDGRPSPARVREHAARRNASP
jgi:RNA polymerase sigma-70 factor (ECF subfamily)